MRITDGHALEEEVAGVLRQAVSLAARRGHAQVTPLHIARSILSAPASILRAACVRSQTHPMQHNALDLCLDLALGSLAVTVVHKSVDPAPSNACVAALKRAQAHQRRCSSAAKVELEKLVVSILDDPGVDRVMRAAGFSSSQVSAIVERAVTSSKRSSRAGCDVLATGRPTPVPDMIIRAGQPSLQTVGDRSECQASSAKTGAGQPAIFGATTASIPPWLRRYKDTTCVRSTYCGASLQADDACRRPMFTELTATNLNILCNALELRVPRHGNIIPGISCTVLRCRSGVTRRAGAKPSSPLSSARATWLLFLGSDYGGKVAVAQELARLVFGSYAKFTAVQLQGSPNNIPARSGKLALKRQRSPGNDGDLGARLFEAIMENPRRVILMDGVDQLDRDSEMHIVGGGMVRGCNGDVVSLEDAIIVLSGSDVLDSRRYVASPSSPQVKRRFGVQNREEGDEAAEMEVRSRHRHGWDLSVCAVDEEDSLADDEGIQNAVDGVFLFN